jgi:hemerythrin
MPTAGPAEHLEPAAGLRSRLGAEAAPADVHCGIPSFDEEHAVCAAASAEALAALARSDAVALALALSEYRGLTEAHFRSEEDLMRACAFPQTAPHAAVHAQYLGFLERCCTELGRSGLTPTVRAWIGDGIPQWDAVHLANDRAVARHVERAGIAVAAETPWRAGVPDVLRARQAAVPAAPGTSSAGRLSSAATEAAAVSRALDGGHTSEARRVLGTLGAGLRELFAAEERLMAESAYVGAAHHALAHDLMLADLALLGRAIDEGAPGAAARWAKLRTEMWLETHHTLADAALDAHLAGLE